MPVFSGHFSLPCWQVPASGPMLTPYLQHLQQLTTAAPHPLSGPSSTTNPFAPSPANWVSKVWFPHKHTLDKNSNANCLFRKWSQETIGIRSLVLSVVMREEWKDKSLQWGGCLFSDCAASISPRRKQTKSVGAKGACGAASYQSLPQVEKKRGGMDRTCSRPWPVR